MTAAALLVMHQHPETGVSDDILNEIVIRENGLYLRLPEILAQTHSHAARHDDLAAFQRFEYSGVTVLMPTVMTAIACVLVTVFVPAAVLRECVADVALLLAPVLLRENDESASAAEMPGDMCSVVRCDCDVHVLFPFRFSVSAS